jgi:predicted DNA-binding protein with PD1-like motif
MKIAVLALLLGAMAGGADFGDWIKPGEPLPKDKAPGMKARRIANGAETTYVVAFQKGDEVVTGLDDFAAAHDVRGARLSAVGAVSDAVLGYFDRSRMEYKVIRVPQQTEILAFTGNITTYNGKPLLHAHVVLGFSDGRTIGGHLFAAHVWPTLEMFVVDSHKTIHKELDPETGLALMAPGESPQ